ncbi:MAG: hypothetical protein M3Q22_10530, partial [Actinomycetota bacterium]|nr:hypothetical protein [Actinomycetota bacterium]
MRQHHPRPRRAAQELHAVAELPVPRTLSSASATIKRVRQRYESDAGDLDGIVQLKMLGQGYDFPPICIVVPL